MPVRLNAKGPGEFIRGHLQEPQTGGRHYVGSMYQAYKDHLRSAGVRTLPCHPTFHKYVWLLRRQEPSSSTPARCRLLQSGLTEPLPFDHEPLCTTSARCHYYRIADPLHRPYLKPKLVWRQRRGLATPVTAPLGPSSVYEGCRPSCPWRRLRRG